MEETRQKDYDLINNNSYNESFNDSFNMEVTGRQIIVKLLAMKKENQQLKALNVMKDCTLEDLLMQFDRVKESLELSEQSNKQSNEMVQQQKMIMDVIIKEKEELSKQYQDTERSLAEKMKQSEAESWLVVKTLREDLNQAKQSIKDKDAVIDDHKRRLFAIKEHYEQVQTRMNERFREQLKKDRQVSEEEKQAMNAKLRQAREYYENEAKDFRLTIRQLKEEVDRLKKVELVTVDANPTLNQEKKKRSRAGNKNAAKSGDDTKKESKAKRGAKSKQQTNLEENLRPETPDDLIDTLWAETLDEIKQKRNDGQNEAEQPDSRSSSPMEWRSPVLSRKTVKSTSDNQEELMDSRLSDD